MPCRRVRLDGGPPSSRTCYPSAVQSALSVVGWTEDRLSTCVACGLLDDGVAFVTPTRWKGETVGRLVFLHPDTEPAVVEEVLARLRTRRLQPTRRPPSTRLISQRTSSSRSPAGMPP